MLVGIAAFFSSGISGTLGYLQWQWQQKQQLQLQLQLQRWGKSRTAGPCRAGQARVGWRDPLQV
ncbi:MAG: hypothetical protein KKH61_18510, partial [Gammaproteobacteria bacterium]|nr:hypothetical protein [Gammaproteobacteria bacterium]